MWIQDKCLKKREEAATYFSLFSTSLYESHYSRNVDTETSFDMQPQNTV